MAPSPTAGRTITTETPKITAREFGRRLQAARKQAGLTQVQAAMIIGTTQPRLSEYERGHVMPPMLSIIEMIETLGLDPQIIFPEFWS